MNVDLEIKYSTDKYSWLCFKHAVQEAMRGEDIKTDIDDWSSEYYMGLTHCIFCAMNEATDENEVEDRLKEWYDMYREGK